MLLSQTDRASCHATFLGECHFAMRAILCSALLLILTLAGNTEAYHRPAVTASGTADMGLLTDVLPVEIAKVQEPAAQQNEEGANNATLPVEQGAYRRWAIISVGADDVKVVAELLTAELSKVNGIELVERDLLAKVAGEQVLSTALSAEGSGNRLHLGEMLHADGLIFLRAGGEREERTLEMVVAECRAGARLRVERFPFKSKAAPELAIHAAGVLADVRRQYAGGIKQVIGVPAFVSHSLSREYDPQQKRYSELLQHVLMLEPGVAVIEIAEARAIGRELALGGNQVKRLVPSFVEGEYRVEAQPGQEPTVTVVVRLTDGTKTLDTFNSGPVALATAPQWITGQLAGRVMAGTANAKPLSVKQQITALSAQADAFAKLGSFDMAGELRESILLLDPDQRAQRVALCNEYARVFDERMETVVDKLRDRYGPDNYRYYKDPLVEAAIDKRVTAFCEFLGHAEYLIRHDQLSFQETVNTFGFPVMERVRLMCLWLAQVAENRNVREDQRYVGIEHLARAEQARRRFLTEVAPLILTLKFQGAALKPDDDASFRPYMDWMQSVQYVLAYDLEKGRISVDSFDFMVNYLLTVVPENIGLARLPSFTQAQVYGPEITETMYWNAVERLRQSKRPGPSTGAEFTLLWHRIEKASQAKDREELLAVQNDLQAFYESMDANPKILRPTQQKLSESTYLYYFPRFVAKEIAALSAPTAAPSTTADAPDTGAVRLEPFKFKYSNRSNSLDGNLLQCGENEIFWRVYASFWYLRQGPGQFEELTYVETALDAYKNLFFKDVVWDGKLIWGLTSKYGVFIMDAKANVLARVSTQEGLPAYDEMRRVIYPIEPGKLLMVGSFGADHRAWCAVITYHGAGDTPVVNVFHEAKRTPVEDDRKAWDQYAYDVNSSFVPKNLRLIRGKAPGIDPVVMIDRASEHSSFPVDLPPLLINLRTLSVSVWDARVRPLAGLDFSPVYLVRDGALLGMAGETDRPPYWVGLIDESQIAANPDAAYRRIPVINPGPIDPSHQETKSEKRVNYIDVYPSCRIVPYDGWIYVIGEGEWWRIDEKTLTAQRLTKTPFPMKLNEIRLSVSAISGLLLHYKNEMYRVTIDETKIPKAGE